MKVNLYAAAINKTSKAELFAQLKTRDKNQQHVIICPDRCTLNIEKELFEVLGEVCFFDLNVVTLSRLSKIAIANTDRKVLTKTSAVALIKKLLLDNKKHLTSFKNAVRLDGFAAELYNTICMFKSCHITPADIDTDIKNHTLANKVNDIKLIYQAYEDFLKNDFTDSFNQLNLFASLINKEMCGGVNYYFVMFEDFTKQQYNIIQKLIRHANSVWFATTYSRAEEVNNQNIHINSIYLNVLDICKLMGVHVNIKHFTSPLPAEQAVVLKNLFSSSPEKGVAANQITVANYQNIKDEVKHTLLTIKQKIMQGGGLKFKDFSIVVPSFIQYADLIKKACLEVDVPYYLDESTPINDHIFCRFVVQLLKIICQDYNKYDVLDLLKSPFADVDCQLVESFEHYIDKYGLVGGRLLEVKEPFSEITAYFQPYQRAGREVSAAQTFGEKLDIFQGFLWEVIKDKEAAFLEGLLAENNIIDYRTHQQVVGKLERAFQQLSLVLDEHDCTSKDFAEIVLAGFADITLTLPPIAMDAVFIGEVNTSYFPENKEVFILGASEGAMPSYQTDTSILTDKDIGSLKNKNKLQPTVAVINKRKRFKVYESLFNFKQSLTISYPKQGAGGEECFAAIWVDSLRALLSIDEKAYSEDFNMVFSSYTAVDKDNILFNNITLSAAKENFIGLLKQWEIYKTNKNYVNITHTLKLAIEHADANFIKTIMQNRLYKNVVENIAKAKQLFFSNNATSISQLETYFQCPYKFFMQYGLKIVKQEEVASIDNGNILHQFLKVIVPLISKNINDEKWLEDSGSTAKRLMQDVLNNPKYDYITANPFNKFYCNAFLHEAERITSALIYQQRHSKFMPNFKNTERFFTSNKLAIKTSHGDILIKGIIDRVDEGAESFRIIDYKTGAYSAKLNDFTDIVSGKKIQLLVYVKAYESLTNLKPAGAFYLPILNVFDKEDAQDLYKLEGIIVKNLTDILAHDSNLSMPNTKSKIVNLSTDKDGVIKYNKLCVSEQELDKLCRFVFTLMEQAAQQIQLGNLPLNPLDGGKTACDFCHYKQVCNFNENYGNTLRTVDKVDTFQQVEELIKGVGNE